MAHLQGPLEEATPSIEMRKRGVGTKTGHPLSALFCCLSFKGFQKPFLAYGKSLGAFREVSETIKPVPEVARSIWPLFAHMFCSCGAWGTEF